MNGELKQLKSTIMKKVEELPPSNTLENQMGTTIQITNRSVGSHKMPPHKPIEVAILPNTLAKYTFVY